MFLRACDTLRFVPLHKARAPTAWSQLNVSMPRVVTVFSPLPFSVNWAHPSDTTDRALLFSERPLIRSQRHYNPTPKVKSVVQPPTLPRAKPLQLLGFALAARN
jgi:hypothetical protein